MLLMVLVDFCGLGWLPGPAWLCHFRSSAPSPNDLELLRLLDLGLWVLMRVQGLGRLGIESRAV